MVKLSAIDEARQLYEKLRGYGSNVANKVGTFVKQNPTPMGYVNKKVVQPITQRIQPVIPAAKATFSNIGSNVQRTIPQINTALQGGINKLYPEPPKIVQRLPSTQLSNVGRGMAKQMLSDIVTRTTVGTPENQRLSYLTTKMNRSPQEEQEYRKLASNEGLDLAIGMVGGSGKVFQKPNLSKAYQLFEHRLGAVMRQAGKKFTQQEIKNAIVNLAKVPVAKAPDQFVREASALARYIQLAESGIVQNAPKQAGLSVVDIRGKKPTQPKGVGGVSTTKNTLGQQPQPQGLAGKTVQAQENLVSASSRSSIPQQSNLLPPGGQSSNPVNKIINALKGAKTIRGQQEALYSTERARRVARVAAMGEKVPGEKGYFAQLGQLKGEMPKVEFESIRKQINQYDIDSLFQQVENTNVFSPFEKVTAKTGLAKLLGAEGGKVPTEGELKLLSEAFPPEFIQAVLDKRTTFQKLFQLGQEALSVPKSIMATGDFSAALRQGIVMIGKPKLWGPAFRDQFKYAFNQGAYDDLLKNIKSRPTYKLMREHGVAITDMGSKLSGREEAFMSSLPEKIPVLGKIVKGSNRAYTGFLNKLRADTFDDMVRSTQKTGQKLTPEIYKGIANFVNNATGRGDLGALNKAATTLNAVMFSPRLVASRMNILNPLYYAKMNPAVRKYALKTVLQSAGVIGSIATLAKLGGMEVGTDPRSADYLKVKHGNTRWDIGGGFAQYIRLAAQLLTGEMISSVTGRKITLGEGYKPITRFDIITRFLENKESPVASLITQALKGQTNLGEDLNIKKEIATRFIPLVLQDMGGLVKEYGAKGILMGIPGIFGVGSQTYGPISEVNTKEPSINEKKKIKDAAIDYYTRGNKDKAKEIKNKYKISIAEEDITKHIDKQKRLAAAAYVLGDKKEAMAIKKDYNLTITRDDVLIAAKKEAIKLYKNGKIKEAIELKKKYGIQILREEVE